MRLRDFAAVIVACTVMSVLAAEASANYHPTAGRWITRDPIGAPAGSNLYEYCASRPRAGTDPAGLQSTIVGYDSSTDRLISWGELYGQYWVPTAREVAAGQLAAVRAEHANYKYFQEDATGLRHMIDDLLNPLLKDLEVKVVSRIGGDTGGLYLGGTLTLLRGGDPHNVFHELIHAYEDITLHKFAADKQAYDMAEAKNPHINPYDYPLEQVTYGSERMAWRAKTWLGGLEKLLEAGAPDYAKIGQTWRSTFNFASPDNRSQDNLVILKGGQRIKQDLGFTLSCPSLAKFYNDTARWPNVGQWCIKFTCDAQPADAQGKDGSHTFHLGYDLPEPFSQEK